MDIENKMAYQSSLNKHQILSVLAILLAFTLISHKTILINAFAPIVETGVSELSPDGKHVGVNVPPFFTMNLDTRGPEKGLRMTQSVLSGLVKINLDRERGANGKFKGPIDVKVGGMTMYNNQEPPLSSK